MELNVYNITGKETGEKVTLSDAIFGIEPNDHAIYLDVKQYLANQRQGTHKSKQRNEVAGSTRKIKKQKGTGGARAGSIMSPLFVGGGRVFGPVPRDYSFKLNKKLKQLARRSALSYKAKAEMITVVDNFQMEPRTKEFIQAAKNLGLSDQKLLIVVPTIESGIALASRNVPNVRVMQVANLNTYDVMNAGRIVMSAPAVEAINQLMANA